MHLLLCDAANAVGCTRPLYLFGGNCVHALCEGACCIVCLAVALYRCCSFVVLALCLLHALHLQSVGFCRELSHLSTLKLQSRRISILSLHFAHPVSLNCPHHALHLKYG